MLQSGVFQSFPRFAAIAERYFAYKPNCCRGKF